MASTPPYDFWYDGRGSRRGHPLDHNTISAMPLNERAAGYLAGHRHDIMDCLFDLRQREPQHPVIQEVDRLGGMGTVGMTMGLLGEMVERKEHETSPSGAAFLVALLHSSTIRSFLRSHSEGRLSNRDLQELRAYFLEQV